MEIGKLIGCVMMVVGCTVGGGMLALPLMAYSAGFIWSVALLIAMYGLMLYTGLLTLEMNMTLPAANSSHNSMAAKVFGKLGQLSVWVVYILMLFSMLVAYITGESDIIVHYLQKNFGWQVSRTVSTILFTFGLGGLVLWSVSAVDYCNRILATLKGLFLAAFLLLATSAIDFKELMHMPEGLLGQAKYVVLAMPTFICAFCYHFVIPSIRMMAGDKPELLKRILIISNLISLAIYVWWLSVAFGVIPLEGVNGYINLVHNYGSSVGKLTQNIIKAVDNHWFAASMNAFTNITLTTAFLGSTLSVFNFLADGLKRPNTFWGRLQSATLTLVTPLLIALFFPDGFVLAMNWSALFTVLLCIIFPAWMVYKYRQQNPTSTSYRVQCNNAMIMLVLIIGIALAVVTIMYLTGCLPVQAMGTSLR